MHPAHTFSALAPGRGRGGPRGAGLPALLLAVTAAMPSGVMAGQLLHSLGLSAGGEYDSNPIMLADDEVSVWRAILNPEYQGRWRSGSLQLEALASLNLERSSDEEVSNNRDDPTVSVALTRDYARGEMSAGASYQQASTRVTELGDTGQVFSDSTLTEAGFRLDLEHAFSERTRVEPFVNYLDVSYDTDVFFDYRLLDAGLTAVVAQSPRFDTYLEALGTRYEPDDEAVGTADSASLLFGFVYRYSESLEFDINAGGVAVSAEEDDSDWNGEANVLYRGERFDLSAGFSKTTAASGIGGFISAEEVTLRASYDYSERTVITLSGQWRKNLDEGLNDSALIELRSETRMSQFWALGVMASYREITGIGDATGYAVSVSLNYRLPERI